MLREIFFGPVLCRKCNLVIRVFWCGRVFSVRGKTVAVLLYFSLIIVKSLQFRGRRQITEPRKYCLMRMIAFFDVYFLYFFFVSHMLRIWVNSLHITLPRPVKVRALVTSNIINMKKACIVYQIS